jgi:hypothetical protein
VSDTEEIDEGLVTLLNADAQLLALAPGGAWWELAPQGTEPPFVIVTQEDHDDIGAQPSADAFEHVTYGVQIMAPATSGAASGTNVDAAAARVKALLHHQTFVATGYSVGLVQRTKRTKELVVDGDRLWQIRGGIYEVWAAPV